MTQMLLQGVPNERGSIDFVPFGGGVRSFQQLGIENDLDRFHCGSLSTVYPTAPQRATMIASVRPLAGRRLTLYHGTGFKIE